ncbi:MAG: hypothetical protein AB7Q42_00545 [Acidimicrobiia bacterium]
MPEARRCGNHQGTGKLQAAGYSPTVQDFPFPYFEELSPAVLEQTAPNTVAYGYLVDFFTMDYSGSGNVTAAVQAVDLDPAADRWVDQRL